MPDDQTPEPPFDVYTVKLEDVKSVVLQRLIEEVRQEEPQGRPSGYNRIYNRYMGGGKYNRVYSRHNR